MRFTLVIREFAVGLLTLGGLFYTTGSGQRPLAGKRDAADFVLFLLLRNGPWLLEFIVLLEPVMFAVLD